MSRIQNFCLLFGLVILSSSVCLAQEGNAEFDFQDAREFATAMAFLEGKGLDINDGVESRTGLWRIVVKEGEGPKATRNDSVTLHTTGWLADGTKFWSSRDDEGEPLTNSASGFVPGFNEGLQTMKAGGTTLVVMPGRLGYGPNGLSAYDIHSNATLIFEIELISIE